MKKTAAFTLIESLTVIAIIGILAMLSLYAVVDAQKRSRDTKRKSDLAAIGNGFQARFEDKTCATKTYPGQGLAETSWVAVAGLTAVAGDYCSTITNYLSQIPIDPNDNTGHPYKFNISRSEGTLPLPGQHYRLGAAMEKSASSLSDTDIDKMNQLWTGSFNGVTFPIASGYKYFIGN